MPQQLTHHAEARCQQRSISAKLRDVIYAYGSESRSRRAACFWLDRRALELATDDLGSHAGKWLERHMGAFLVVSDEGAVITAAHSTRRLRIS
ncbi:hypothetical protein [Defluviimonas salinarum]|uniref:DUF4258 domain-containing protein n=1 Tax=Defluviimonas salinarum TaxID=2992147 RepID=A0ABT3J1L2_9RHOB|nr:hypothetical protein [Defluviimonas salinarum]MCW3781563.1 hypothetical protein [Defluviimonas salinarum]